MTRTRLSCCLLLVAVLVGCTAAGAPSHVDSQRVFDNHLQLALGYIGTGNRDSARHHLEKASDIDSRASGLLHAYALLYQSEGETELAETQYRRAIAADRHFSQARLNYGVFLFGLGRHEEAFEQFEHASEDLGYEMRPVAFSHLGLTAARLGRTERAAAAFRRAIQLDPGMSRPYLELAQLAYEAADYALAKRWLDQYGAVAQASAASLWLGVRIARQFGDRDAEASHGLALRNLFPYSEQNLAYQQWLQRNDEH